MSDNAIQLFNQGGDNSLMAQSDAAAVARATQEIQAALVIAQRFGRDDVKVATNVLKACQRPELAEVAEYEYSRGGTKITGPTIDLIRVVANRMGNIRFGWTEVDRRAGADGVGVSSVRAFAWDLFTNSQSERTFSVKHWRDTQNGGYAIKEERDIYEMLANQASRRVRACLEEVIDPDLINKAIEQCRLTMKQGAKGVSLKDQAVQMVAAFADMGVTQEMIERRLGNKLDAVSQNQIASLRRVYKSLRDGVGTREDYFKPETARPEFGGTGAGQATGGVAGQPASTVPNGTQQPSASPGGAVGGASAPAPTDDGDLGPTTPPAGAPPTAAEPPLKKLRRLAKEAKIKEGALLEHFASVGSTDGSYTSLDELQLGAPAVVQGALDYWEPLVAAIKAKGAK